MPSFDVVSEVDMHDVHNAVDQANRELERRFDFRGVDARFELKEEGISISAESDFQIKQMLDILREKLVKRSVDVGVLDEQDIVHTGKIFSQLYCVQQGIDSDQARKLVKMIKEQKLKVQAAIQGDKVRVTGKKRDDLQATIAFLKQADVSQPLQFDNFRD